MTIPRTKSVFLRWLLFVLFSVTILTITVILIRATSRPYLEKPHTVITVQNAHQIRLLPHIKTRWWLDVEPQFSDDSQIMLLPDIDGVHIWDWEAGRERFYIHEEAVCVNDVCDLKDGGYDINNFNGKTFRYALSLNGRLVALAMNRGNYHNLRVWDTVTGRAVKTLGSGKGLRALAFSPDSSTLIFTGEPGDTLCSGLCGWNIETDEIFLIDDLKPFEDWVVVQLDFVPDHSTLVYSARDIKTYNFATREQHVIFDDERAVFAFSPNSDFSRIAIVNGGFERPGYSVSVWDVSEKMPIYTVFPGVVAEVWDVQFSPRDNWFAAGGEIHVWDAATRSFLFTLKNSGVGYRQNFAVHPDGTIIAARQGYDGMGFWDVSTGDQISLVKGGDRTTKLAFSPDGTLLVTSEGAVYGIP